MFGYGKFPSPPSSPNEGRKNSVRLPIIPFCISPSQLNEVSACTDFTFSNSLRSPESQPRGRSIQEFEEQLQSLKKENFDLKLRIYFLEERMGVTFDVDKKILIKSNIDFKVENEKLKKDLQEKHELLCEAVKAMDLEEKEYKKFSQSKNREIETLQQRIKELEDMLPVRDISPTYKSTYSPQPSDSTYCVDDLTESKSRMEMLQKQVSLLESQLEAEKEKNASLQIVADQFESTKLKYEQLKMETDQKDKRFEEMKADMKSARETVQQLMKDLKQMTKLREKFETDAISKSDALEERLQVTKLLENKMEKLKEKYVQLKVLYQREHSTMEKRTAELTKKLEMERSRVQNLEKQVVCLSKRSPLPAGSNFDSNRFLNEQLETMSEIDQNPRVQSFANNIDFDGVMKALDALSFPNKTQTMESLESMKTAIADAENTIIRLKAQELKACAIIKNLLQQRTTLTTQLDVHKNRILYLEGQLYGVAANQEVEGEVVDQEIPGGDEVDNHEAIIHELQKNITLLDLTCRERNALVEDMEAPEKEQMRREMEQDSPALQGKAAENYYAILIESKNREIEKLSDELKRRTNDLQTVVNNELWQKNREIEKMRVKYDKLVNDKEKELEEIKAENERKLVENSSLTIDNSDLRWRLQMLIDKIGEIGMIQDENAAEVDVVILSLDEAKKRIDSETSELKKRLESSEAVRKQTNNVCYILKTQLEELAVFLDSLMRQKSVLGFLGLDGNQRLREAIDHSLDLSKSINVSLDVPEDQSLLQLSNITELLNGSLLSNDDAYRYSLMSERSTYPMGDVSRNKETDDEKHRSFMLKSMRDQLAMLQREVKMKNGEIARLKREPRSSIKPRTSPNKAKQTIIFPNKDSEESESWSEPDVVVSKARIGLFNDNARDELGVAEIPTSTSESATDDNASSNQRRPETLNECYLTISQLNRQMKELQKRLQGKETECTELKKMIDMGTMMYKSDIEQMKQELSDVSSELDEYRDKLSSVEEQKYELEIQIETLNATIADLEKTNMDIKLKNEAKDKEAYNKLNQLKVERDQLMNLTKEYSDMSEKARKEVDALDEKVKMLNLEKESLTKEIEENNECKQKLEEKLQEIDLLYIQQNEMQMELDRLEELEEENSKLQEELKAATDREYAMMKEAEAVAEEMRALKKMKDSSEMDRLKLEVKVSEMESGNADLRNKLVRATTSLPPAGTRFDVKSNSIFSIVTPRRTSNVDQDRVEASPSPDLGIESDQGRFSSLEGQGQQVQRPLLETIEIVESMKDLLDGDNKSDTDFLCENSSCQKKMFEILQKNSHLKKKYLRAAKALHDTVNQLSLAKQRKKEVEENICKQLDKTSQVLKKAKANLDSGSETDFARN